MSLSVSILSLSHTYECSCIHKQKLLVNSTQTLPQIWASVCRAVFVFCLCLSLSVSLSNLETSVVWQLNQVPPRARKREMGEKQRRGCRKKRGGGWGGEAVSYYLSLLFFCYLPSICFPVALFQFHQCHLSSSLYCFLVKSFHLIVYETNIFTSICFAVTSVCCFSIHSFFLRGHKHFSFPLFILPPTISVMIHIVYTHCLGLGQCLGFS